MLWPLMDGQLSHRRTPLKDQEDFLALRVLLIKPRRHACMSSEVDYSKFYWESDLGQVVMMKIDFMEFKGKQFCFVIVELLSLINWLLFHPCQWTNKLLILWGRNLENRSTPGYWSCSSVVELLYCMSFERYGDVVIPVRERVNLSVWRAGHDRIRVSNQDVVETVYTPIS